MNNYDNISYYQHNGRSNDLERAANILGTISLLSCAILYISIPCGCVAIILACLSKGSTTSITRRAQKAIILGGIGIIACIVTYMYSFLTLYRTYGSVQGILDALTAQYGIPF